VVETSTKAWMAMPYRPWAFAMTPRMISVSSRRGLRSSLPWMVRVVPRPGHSRARNGEVWTCLVFGNREGQLLMKTPTPGHLPRGWYFEHVFVHDGHGSQALYWLFFAAFNLLTLSLPAGPLVRARPRQGCDPDHQPTRR